jgi:hypothetical protein
MRHLFLSLLVICSISSPIFAQTVPGPAPPNIPGPPLPPDDPVPPESPEEKPPEIIKWAIPPQVIYKNIHFILDRSGSMSTEQLASAMGAFLGLAEQAVDEINIAITVFGQEAVRWDGTPDEHTPHGWAGMPSKIGLDAAKDWLNKVAVNGSSTVVGTAIATVDTRPVPRHPGGNLDEVTVIIISDLIFDNYPSDLLGAIQTLKKARDGNHCKGISFGFIGVHTSVSSLTSIRDLSLRENFWVAYTGPNAPRPAGEELPCSPLPDEPDPSQQQLPPGPGPLPLPPDPSPLPPPSPY